MAIPQGQLTSAYADSVLSDVASSLLVEEEKFSAVDEKFLVEFLFFPSLFTFRLKTPLNKGDSEGEECSWLFTLSSPSLHQV